MTEVQIAVLVGFVVSLALQLLKRWWPGLDTSEAVTKQVTACVMAAVGVLIAAHWQFSGAVGWQMLVAAVAALATHKALLAQGSTAPLGG